MRKIYLVLAVLGLSSCVYAGEYNILSSRKDIFTKLNGYNINFYNHEPELIKTEYIHEKNYKLNETMTAYRGYTVISNKTYRKDFYRSEFVKADKNLILYTASIPQKYKAAEKMQLIGDVLIDGVEYRLVPSSLKDFVVLIDERGNIYKHMGQIKGNTLVIMEPVYYPHPEDAKIVNVDTIKTEQTKPISGYDVKYSGIKLDRIWFTYLDYAFDNSNRGTFEEISFPNKPGLIKVEGIGIRILDASNERISYQILK